MSDLTPRQTEILRLIQRAVVETGMPPTRAEIAEDLPYELTGLQRMFLFTRSDTIYAGTNQIQRNIIAERALGLPREPKLAPK